MQRLLLLVLLFAFGCDHAVVLGARHSTTDDAGRRPPHDDEHAFDDDDDHVDAAIPGRP